MKLLSRSSLKQLFREALEDLSALGSPTIHLALTLVLLLGQSSFAPQLAITLAATYLLNGGIKMFGPFEMRPKGSRQARTWLEHFDNNARVSGHTASSFALAITIGVATTTTALVALLAFACFVGYTRLALKRHTVANVLSGMIVGLIIAFGVSIVF